MNAQSGKAAVVLLAIIIMLLCAPSLSAYAAVPSTADADAAPKSAASAQTSAECMAVMEAGTYRLLYAKDAHKKRPMASTTKIATAITVIEKCPDLQKTVTVPAAAAGVEGSSIYLAAGEKVKLIDLLYGLMLQSGNDCAAALAITTAGGIPQFAAQMNETAQKIGAKNTNFVNPHGLHHDDHYTTAYDLALISSYAMKNPVFKQIVGTKRHTMPWEGRDYDRVIVNKNKILSTFTDGNGVKTGYTKKAGRCLVSGAERGGMQVVAAVLNCGPMFEECGSLMQKAFDEFELCDVGYHGDGISIPTVDARGDSVTALPGKTEKYPLKKDGSEIAEIVVEQVESLTAPQKKGTEAGKIKIFLNKQLLFEQKLYTMEEVRPLTYLDKLRQVIAGW